MNLNPSITVILLLCCIFAGQQKSNAGQPPAADFALAELQKDFTRDNLRKAKSLGLNEFAIIDLVIKNDPDFNPNDSLEAYAALKEKKRAMQSEHLQNLRRDLDATINDLKARWFPKRTKVENYNVIALTAVAIAQSGGGNPFNELLKKENNPYGLTEGDIIGINAAYQRNLPPDTSALENKIDALASQNERLKDQVQDARDAASDAAMEARDANSEIERANLLKIAFPKN